MTYVQPRHHSIRQDAPSIFSLRRELAKVNGRKSQRSTQITRKGYLESLDTAPTLTIKSDSKNFKLGGGSMRHQADGNGVQTRSQRRDPLQKRHEMINLERECRGVSGVSDSMRFNYAGNSHRKELGRDILQGFACL